MDATETQDTLGKRLLKMQHIHFFYVVLQRLYGGTKGGCTVIQRAKHFIVLEACHLSKLLE